MKRFLTIGLLLIATVAVANTNLWSNLFWFDQYGVPLQKTYSDFKTHTNFVYNVVNKFDENCGVTDSLTWANDYEWTPTAYDGMIEFVGTDCTPVTLIPYSELGGYYLNTNGYISIWTNGE